MGDLIVNLIPLAIGIVLSPLAIMAMVAVLLSQSPRSNGIAYLVGWAIAVTVSLGVGIWVFNVLEVHEVHEPPRWVAVVRFALGVVLIATAVWMYRRGHVRVRDMAAASSPADVRDAAPQLPGWLHAVETFRPLRSAALGFALFVVNPVDLSCAILASLDIVLADLARSSTIGVTVGFGIVAVLPIAVPVVLVVVAPVRARPVLDWMRTWIATHTSVLNSALLLVVGAMQIQKSLSS